MIATSFALFFNGLHAGSMLFVSGVDARMLTKLSNQRNDVAIRTIFPIWWPYGRDLMAPLGIASTLAHIAAYVTTKQQKWAVAGALVFSTILWTGTVMRKAIAELRVKESEEVLDLTKTFCKLHQVRLLASCGAYVAILFA